MAQPDLHTFGPPDAPLRLEEHCIPQDDPDPKALACYGLLLRQAPATEDTIWLRFVDGRPGSAATIHVLSWSSIRLAKQGKTALLLVWDNASWHGSKAVRTWVRDHHQHVTMGQTVGVRIMRC